MKKDPNYALKAQIWAYFSAQVGFFDLMLEVWLKKIS
jgi:hypothetical protein